MIVLGLDVGSTEVGIALLDVPHGALRTAWPSARAELLRAAKLDLPRTLDILDAQVRFVELVVIEPPVMPHPGVVRQRGVGAALGIAKHVAAATKIAGALMERCRARGLRVIEVPAVEWRRALVGNASAKDAQVARALSFRIEWGKKRVNADHRDAAGAALWGAQQHHMTRTRGQR